MKIRSMPALVFLVALGCLQIAGDLLRMPKVKGLAAATQVAPAMKVFTAHQGYETHAARFTLTWRDGQGEDHQLALTPQSYATVRGPYNRRNVYGAALAYGPLLRKDPATRRMQESVMHYAFCVPGVLRDELGVPADATQLRARVVPVRAPMRTDLELEWEINCDA